MVKKNKFAYRKSKSIPVKANVEAQKFFLNNVLLPLLQRAVENQCKVFFCDGVHLIYGYIGGYRWCKKRVCVPSAYGRKRANLLGFLDPISLKTEQIMNDTYLNSDSVCEGLKLLRKKYPFSPIFIVLDNAAYQRCKKVKDFAAELSISLVFLPPYSPNLNLIERLWKFLRNNLLSDKYFHTFSEFYNSISDFIDYVHIQHFSALRSLISFNFVSFEDLYILDLL